MNEKPATCEDNDVLFPLHLVMIKRAASSLLQVLFRFTAAFLGSASVRCQATVGGKVVDSFVMPLSVKTPQLPVDVATSFAVRLSPDNDASGQQHHWEGLVLPQALPGSGSLSLFAGLGHLAAIEAALLVRCVVGGVGECTFLFTTSCCSRVLFKGQKWGVWAKHVPCSEPPFLTWCYACD